ncbi:cation transmembrane transporter [Aureococcus anophagefferens]|nr:cation transmembrane transporter [Aureococcus anophagefferens]
MHRPTVLLLCAAAATALLAPTPTRRPPARATTLRSTLDDDEMMITVAGAGVNVVASAAKAVVGVACNSQVLIADAVHSASDLVSDAVAMAAVRMNNAPPTALYPQGCGKAGSVGALIIGAMLAAGGLGLAWAQVAGLARARAPRQRASRRGRRRGLRRRRQELLARATLRVGRFHESAAVLANAKHHRSTRSSVVALLGVVGSRVHPLVDPAAALVVAGWVAKMGYETCADALLELTDAADAAARRRRGPAAACGSAARRGAGLPSASRFAVARPAPSPKKPFPKLAPLKDARESIERRARRRVRDATPAHSTILAPARADLFHLVQGRDKPCPLLLAVTQPRLPAAYL